MTKKGIDSELEQLSVARTITQANMIEGMMDAYIAEFYTRCPAGDYLQPYLALIYDVLASRNMTLNAKVDILFKVYKRINPKHATKKHRKNYAAWIEIRNKFAHGRHIGSSDGYKLFYAGEFLNVTALADEFMEYQRKITEHMEVYSELRGAYFNQIPTRAWERIQ